MTATTETLDLSYRYIPTAKQMIAHMAPERYLLYGGAFRGGKSVFLCNEAIQLSLDHKRNRGFLGRWENKTFKTTTFLTLQDFLDPRIIVRHHQSDQYYDFVNGSRLYYGGLKPSGSSNPIDKFKSMDLGWFAIDEASQLPEEMFLIFASRLSLKLPGIRYRGLLASNPERGWLRGRFIARHLRDHRFVPALPKDNPHNPPDYEEKLRDIFPEEWILRYLEGDWDAMMGENYVFPFAWIQAAIERTLEPGEPTVVGIDFAAGGVDMTVAAIRQGPVARIIHRSSHTNTMQTTGELAKLLDERRPVRSSMDPIGVGKGPYDRLLEQGYEIVAYIAGERATEPNRFKNRRAEDHWHFREELEDGLVDLPNDEVISGQLSTIKYETGSDKVIQIESKKKMRPRISLDDAEAIIQCFSEGNGPVENASVSIWTGREAAKIPDEEHKEEGKQRLANVSII